MPQGYFSLILHAHLPFVRHPEYPEFLEEDWLYEAITEVYIPLAFIFKNLHENGVRVRVAMNISPPLCEMLADTMLQNRYTRHLENLLALARQEAERTMHEQTEFHAVAQMYYETLSQTANLWHNVYNKNLVGAFRELQDDGAIEIITCGATHGFLPLMSSHQAKRAQIQIAAANYRKHFGRNPRGIWLPECAYEPHIEDLLKEAGIEYFVADAHALLYGEPRPRYGVHAPVKCANGVAVFARDMETSQQVWSSIVGYPGDGAYREFYRDVGWDLPLDYLKPFLHEDGKRRGLGLKYHRITGRDVSQTKKEPYIPELAREKAAQNAAHFVGERIKQAHQLRELYDGREPLVVSPYDAELYGHWWFEGPQFLDYVFRKLHYDQTDVLSVTPGDFLDADLPIQTQKPSASSWGERGYYKVWLNEGTSWMYPYQHIAEERMTRLADLYQMPNALEYRALNQCARELLLAQSSDWAFQIYQGTTVEYASRRFRSHIHRFDLLAGDLEKNAVDELRLAKIESRDNIFAEIDYRVYRS